MTALPVCPDLSSLDQQTAECLVEHPRQSSSKKQRFDKKIYGQKVDGSCHIRTKLIKGKSPANDEHSLHVALKAAGIPEDKVPAPKSIKRWLDLDSGEPLRLKDGTAVESIPAKAGKTASIIAQLAHRDREGKALGVRISNEANWRLEVWKTQEGDRIRYHTRIIPHPRLMRVFKSSRGQAAWRKKQQSTGKTWRQEISGSLPPFAKKVGYFEKGMTVELPLSRDGSVAAATSCYKRLPYAVTSIKSDGRIELQMTQVKPAKDGTGWPYPDLPPSCYEKSVSASERLAELLASR